MQFEKVSHVDMKQFCSYLNYGSNCYNNSIDQYSAAISLIDIIWNCGPGKSQFVELIVNTIPDISDRQH